MKIADLFIKLGLKKDGFDRGIDGSKQKVSAFSGVVKKIGGIIAGAFAVRQIIAWGNNMINAYDVQAKAEQQLLTALKGRKGAQEDLINQAKQLQKTTLFGDEETIKAQALIAAFVKEKDQIKTIIPLVQDLASAKMMQLSVAADLVSKTLGSGTNALSRYGIEVKGAVGSSERLQSLVEGLSNAFGGQAAAAAKVGTGPLTQLKNAYGDLKEYIGGVIARSTTFRSIIHGLTGFVSKLTSETNSHAKAIEQEGIKVNELGLKFNDPNTKEEERRKILAELKKIAPDVVKGIDDEKGSLDKATISLKQYNEQQLNRIVIAKRQDEIDTAVKAKNDLLIKQKENEIKIIQDLAKTQNALNQLPQTNPMTNEMRAILNSDMSLSEKAIKINETKVKWLAYETLAEQKKYSQIGVSIKANQEYFDTNKKILEADQKIAHATQDKTDLLKDLGISTDEATKLIETNTQEQKKNADATEKSSSEYEALKQALIDAKAEFDTLMNKGGKWHGEQSAQDFIDKLNQVRDNINKAQDAIDKFTKTREKLNIPALLSPRGTESSGIGSNADMQGAGIATTKNQGPGLGVSHVLDKLIEKIKEQKDEITNVMTDINQAISSGISNAIISLSQGLGQLAAGAITGKDFGKQVLDVVGKFMQTLGGLIVTLGVGMLHLEVHLASLNPLGVIAAGALLVAAGSAVSSYASKGLKGAQSSAPSASGYNAGNYNQSRAANVLNGNVTFELHGTMLQGVLNNTNRRNSIIG